MSERRYALELWIEFDQLWTKVHEQCGSPMSSYWQEVYDAMHLATPHWQKLVGQDAFNVYLDE